MFWYIREGAASQYNCCDAAPSLCLQHMCCGVMQVSLQKYVFFSSLQIVCHIILFVVRNVCPSCLIIYKIILKSVIFRLVFILKSVVFRFEFILKSVVFRLVFILKSVSCVLCYTEDRYSIGIRAMPHFVCLC